MAYVQSPSSNRRAFTLGTVALLHAAGIAALVSGFGVTFTQPVDAIFEARNIPQDPPPPEPSPTLDPNPATVETRAFVPKPILDLPADDNATVVDIAPTPQPLIDPGPGAGAVPALDPPSPLPSFTPRRALPLGSPGRWATSDDYPAAALREGREGVTRFRVTVGTDGRVNNCEVTGSSGSVDLDRATCLKVSQRARFKPATDEAGAVVAGSYSSAIRWDIPD